MEKQKYIVIVEAPSGAERSYVYITDEASALEIARNISLGAPSAPTSLLSRFGPVAEYMAGVIVDVPQKLPRA